jgi:hypothetical protein
VSVGSLIVASTIDKDDQVYNGSDATWVLPSTPLTVDALHITTDSGTNLIRGVDYSVSVEILSLGSTIQTMVNHYTHDG